jgi:hypothetical protein
MDIQSKRGSWLNVLPARLSKKEPNSSWIFAAYMEYPEGREDENYYKAFLFRNEDRTVFGIKEFYEGSIIDFRKLAARVVQDKSFRDSLVSDDPDLPKIWKRR